MNVSAKISGITYKPLLCRFLNKYDFLNLRDALKKEATFILGINKNSQIALSWWVSPKRTRSYPYTRVYDSLNFQGRKVTIIPIFKDEGKDGDRDFLQWDTVSLMSLLGIYVIVSYYKNARRSFKYNDKITEQEFDIRHITNEINDILTYQSDALHWNLSQIEKAGEICRKALSSYERISKEFGIKLHSRNYVESRIEGLLEGRKAFMSFSRDLAKRAQKREVLTIQPKEKLSGVKAELTIENYLGGHYFFTCDEIEIKEDNVFLIEGKHSKLGSLPSLEDIKDGLIKMILFTNLEEVAINGVHYIPKPILKLTSATKFSIESLTESQLNNLRLLKKEAETNNFDVRINEVDLKEVNKT